MISLSNKTEHQLTLKTDSSLAASLSANCRDFIDKDSWPPNSPDMNLLDFHVWSAMLEAYNRVNPKPHNIAEMKEMLKDIWDKLPIDSKSIQFSMFRNAYTSLC